jgi:glycosyltransferase involved in cell wall biosynthesis
MMRVFHIAEKINEKAGGTSVHICRLAEATADLGQAEVEIVAFDLVQLGCNIKTAPNVKLKIFPKEKPYLYGHSRSFRRYVEQVAADGEAVLHIHNLWRMPMVYASSAAYRRHRPSVVSPHGALNPWSLTVKAWPKRILWYLVEERRLRRTTVLRATSMPEAEYLHRMVPSATVAIIPPGTDLPALLPRSEENGPRTALFLSRLTPNKGLLTLLQAWAKVRPSGWKLEIYGSDEKNHLADCRKAARELELEPVVSFNGPAFQEKRWGHYLNADLFVLPTVSENFGIAIAEALASAVPVITTRAAPWEDLVRHQCGWWIDLGLDHLVQALREATRTSPAELKQMGQRGRTLVKEKYCWSCVAQEMMALYQWLQGGGTRPETIQFPLLPDLPRGQGKGSGEKS